MIARALLAAFCALASAGTAQALSCTSAMSDINFGSVSVRSGVTNATSGTLQVTCTGALVAVVGVCVRFGPGSGGAAADLSPRYMRRADGAALNYQLRAGGNGAQHGTWDSAFFVVPVVLGRASAAITVHADITSSGVSTGTGSYSSTFSGSSDVQVTYGVPNCASAGQTAPPGPFTVSAEVQSSCEVDSSALNFGNVPFQVTAPIDRETVLTVRCTAATDYAIRLGPGEGPGVTDPAARRMRFLTGTLTYGLYKDSGRTSPWGDLATNDVDSRGLGTDQSFTIYGRIHGGQNVLPGLYSDAVVVTIEY